MKQMRTTDIAFDANQTLVSFWFPVDMCVCFQIIREEITSEEAEAGGIPASENTRRSGFSLPIDCLESVPFLIKDAHEVEANPKK